MYNFPIFLSLKLLGISKYILDVLLNVLYKCK